MQEITVSFDIKMTDTINSLCLMPSACVSNNEVRRRVLSADIRPLTEVVALRQF